LGKLRKEYTSLFGDAGEASETSGGERVETFITKYGWLNAVDNLTNGRPELWDYYFDMNIIEFLNRLAFHKAKGAHERQMSKRR